MNKTDLIAAAAQSAGVSKKDTEKVLNAALEAMAAALAQGDRVQLSGFGVFSVKDREARTARNPKTQEPMELSATRLPVFKASRVLKEQIAKEHAAG